MRASQQDMQVYIGDELIKEYTTKESRLFGNNSASAFVFFQVPAENSGQTLAIELTSKTEYSGFLNKVYVGEKNDIVNELIRQCFGVFVYSKAFCQLSCQFQRMKLRLILHVHRAYDFERKFARI